MKPPPPPPTAAPATLQTVLDRLAGKDGLSDGRKRDLRSGVPSFAKLKASPGGNPARLADLRRTLDGMVPAAAKVSPKRWANLRSDLAAAIETSGLRPMLKTGDLDLDEAWTRLLAPADQRVRQGLSRFARWASLRGITPEAVDDSTIARFVAELDAATLIRNLRDLARTVAKAWNALVGYIRPLGCGRLRCQPKAAPIRIPWQQFPASFREDVERYLAWAAVPDPLARGGSGKGPRAAEPAPAANSHPFGRECGGCGRHSAGPDYILASLVEPETFRALLRHRWREDGCALSAYTHGVAVTLIAIASEWVKAPADAVATSRPSGASSERCRPA